ncbi:MAG: RHS repeat-associated core domain-containing protein, partial [Candidatus Cloacimonadales bacterium]
MSSYNYDAFGNLMTSTVSEEVVYQYTGQEYDSELDLHNFRARFYDSELMRFYAVDPQWQTASPYIFCGNSPLMYVDPDGEWYISANFMGFGIQLGEDGAGLTFMGVAVNYDWTGGGFSAGFNLSPAHFSFSTGAFGVSGGASLSVMH